MSRKVILLVLALALSLTSSVYAATIVWVLDNKDPTDGVPADHAWVDMLIANGYTVNLDFSNAEAGVLSEAEIIALNAADLIIVSRNINSGTYDDGDEPTTWNSIETPLILQPFHIARSSHWRWFNTTTLGNALTELEVVDLNHRLFDGVPLSESNRVAIIQGQPCTTGFVTDVGNGKLIGRRADTGGAWIMEWEAGQEFFPGAEQFAGGRRMYFAGGGTQPDGTYNLTAEGEKVFLNAIQHMLGPAERLKAYRPTPQDGSRYEDVRVKLSWSAGVYAVSHDVYLGEDYDDVRNGTGGTFRDSLSNTFYFAGRAGYPYPDGLVPGTTYYWRIDEVNDANPDSPWTGDVWSFTVARAGGGIRGDYYDGMNFGSLELTRVDPQINFNWGNEAPDPSIDIDEFSVRWTGEVEAAFTETYTFYTLSNDGVRLWADGRQLIDHWTEHGIIEDKGTIDLVAGGVHSILMEYFEGSGVAVIQLS